MAALLDLLGVGTIERTGAAGNQAGVLGRADGGGNCPAVLNKLSLRGITEGVRWSWLKGKVLIETKKNTTSTS